jgi:hypothetical protein
VLYSALLHASHILDRRSVVVILYNGDEEKTKYPNLCREALRVQRKFEIEKAYKIYNVRHIHTMNMLHNRLDYELIATMLQMMIAAQGFTHLYYYLSKDLVLCEMFKALIRVKKIAYNHHHLGSKTACSEINLLFLDETQGLDVWKAAHHILHDAEYDKKVGACKKMVTIDNYLLSYDDFRVEYTCPHKEE